MRERIVFLTEFVIALAVVVGVAFAWQLGLVQAIWRADESYMTSAIAAQFAITVAILLRAAWREDRAASKFGHWAERSLPMLGILGTMIGVSMLAAAKSQGLDSLDALRTGLFASACGVGSGYIVSYMTYILEHGK